MKNVVTMTVVGSLLCAFSSLAEVRTWSGDGVDASWQTLENWDNGVPVAGDSLVFAGDKNLMPANNLSAGMSFAGITFGAGAGTFALTGNGLVLAGDLVNHSDVAQHIGLPVAVNGTRTFNAAAGDIVQGGALSYSGSMTLTKQGTNELVFSGSSVMAANSNNGKIELRNGTLRFAENSVFTMGNNNNTRDIFVSGNAANQKTKMIVEQGACVTLGGFNIQVGGGHVGNSFDLLLDGGHLNMIGTDNSFGDQGGNSQMSIRITNGGSLTNSVGDFNAGTRSPLAITVDNGSFHVNNLNFGRLQTGSGRPGGKTILNIIEGAAYVGGIWQLDTSGDANRTNVVTVGDGRIGKATFNVGSIQRVNPDAKTILNLNGGEMTFRNNATLTGTFLHEINILESSVFLNVTSGASVSIAMPLSRASGVSDISLTKRGPGTLAFNNDVSAFRKPIRVEGGTLRFSSQLPQQIPGLYVAEGGTLSLLGPQSQALQPGQVLFGGASATAATVELGIEPNGTNPDTIHFPVDTTIGRLNVRLCERNTEAAFSGIGDFVLFTYAAEPPDVSLWTYGNCPATLASEFVVDRANKRIILRTVAYHNPNVNDNYEWLNPLGGLWDTGGNWAGGSVPPDAPTTWCRLWDVLSTPSVVTLNREASIRGLSFRGANAYTLTGAGSLKLISYNSSNAIYSDTGTHTIKIPITLAQETRIGGTGASAQLNVDGVISGTGPVVLNQVGTVSLTAANTFTGGLTLSAGTLETAEGGAFGTGLFTFGGGTLNALDTMTVPNTWAVSANSTLNIPSGKTVSLGDISAFANTNLTLPGAGTLELYGSANIPNNVSLRPRQGTVRVMSGANYLFPGSNREALYMQGVTASTPVRLEVLPGAMFLIGVRTLLGQHSILVDGGTLLIPGVDTQLADDPNSTVDMRVTNGGVFRQDGSPGLNIGIHGFTRMTIDNGGTVSGARVTLGGNGYTATTRPGSCEVNVSSGGTFEARDCFAWLSTGTTVGKTADLNILNGGTVIIPATVRDDTSVGYNIATLTLDGGELVCSGLPINVWGTPSLANYLSGLDHVILGEDGGAIDVGRHDITITQTLEVPSAVTAADGLVKRGMGALTLAGGIDTPIPLTVAQGLLVVGGTPAFTDATVAGDATIAVGNAWDVSGTLTFGAGSAIRWDGAHTAGTYTLATFGTLSGTLPSVINMQPGRSYAMVVNGNDLELIVIAPVNDSQWAPDADGNWNVGTNWTTDPNVPNTAGHLATFADIFTVPRFVSLSTPVSLSGLFFDAQHAPVLQGTVPLAFKPATGGGVPGICVTKGAPVIETLVDVASGTATDIASGTTLTLANEVINAGPLNVTGQGTLLMSGTNLTAAVDVSGATFALNGTSRQEALVNLNGATLMLLDSISVAMPLTVGTFGGTLAQPDSTVVAHEGATSGLGTLTRMGNGTLVLPALPDVDLALGKGTLAVTSTVKQVWAKSLWTGADGQISILRNDGDIELAGPVNGTARFIKTGAGTLSYTYPGAMTLSANLPGGITENITFDIGANGEAPTQGAYTYNILEGTVVMGVPGQVVSLPNTTMIGGRTTETAGAETEGHLIVNGGVININAVQIARGNGSAVTAPTPLSSSVTINGGELNIANNITMGALAGLTVGTARPRFIVNGGKVTAVRLLLPEVVGCVATAVVNGGEMRLSNDVAVGGNSGGTGYLVISNGLLYVQNAINLGNTSGATGTLHIAGGVVEVVNVTKSNANGYGRILFDGGLFAPRAGPLAQPNEGQVLAGGLKIKVPATGGYTLNIPFTDSGLLTDAGLTKSGLGYLTAQQRLLYKGPTVIEEGELRLSLTNSLPDTTSLTMRPGSAFQGPSLGAQTGMAVYNFKGLTLGEVNADPVTVRLFLSKLANDRFVVDGEVELGDVAFDLYEAGTTAPMLFNGTYTIITYTTGADPDVSRLSVANALDNRLYSFQSGNGQVTLTIADNPSADADVIWTTGDGNWNTGTSWQSGTVPLSTPKVAQFPWQADPVAVTVDTAASIGGLLFRSSYTLDGANTLTLGTGASISGASTVRAPLAVANAEVVSVQPNGGRLTLGGDVTGANAALSLDTAGQLRVESNTVATAVNVRESAVLEVGEGSEITKDVTLFAGRIDAPGNGKISGAVSLQFGQREIRPSPGSTLQVDGPVVGNASLLINGAGRVELGAPSTYTGTTTVQGGGTLALRAPATAGSGGITLNGTTLATTGTDPVEIDNTITLTGNATLNTEAPLTSMGDIIYSPATTIRNITKTGTNEFAFGGTFSYLNTDTTGAGRLAMQDGIIRFLPGSRYSHIVAPTVRNQVQANTIAGSTGGITVEPDAEVTLTSIMVRSSVIAANSANFRLQVNGLLTFVGDEPICLGDQNGDRIFVEVNEGGVIHAVEDDSWTDLGTRSPVYWVMNGGVSTLGRVALGRQTGATGDRNGGGTTLVISNGLWEARSMFSWHSAGNDANSVSTVTLGCGEPLQGIFSVPPTVRPQAIGQVILNQNGGILRALPAPAGSGAHIGNPANFLNGINAWNVGLGGAAVDVPDAGNAITITHAMTLAPEHGGFTKTGPGTLTLAQPLAVTGTVMVADGTLKADVASTPDLYIHGGNATLDMQGNTANFRDVSGAGFAVNGTVTVSGTLDPRPSGNDGETATFHADNFTFKAGSTYRYEWLAADDHDLIAVSGAVAKEGVVTIDFGREEDPLFAPTLPFTCVIGTYGTVDGPIGNGWKVKNTGLPARIALNATVTAEKGELILKIASGGTLMIVR